MLVPSAAPTAVPTASAAKARLARGSSPRSSTKPPRRPTPIRVPAVSMMSTNRKAKTTTRSLPVRSPEKSKANRVSLGSAGTAASFSGGGASPVAQAMAVVAAMVTRIEPRTRAVCSAPSARSAARASSTAGRRTSPRVTSVAGWSTTRPALARPITARKSPMPAIVASLIERGMALSSAARTPLTDSAKNSRPSTNTAARAVCQETPRPTTTPNVK